MSSIEGRCCSHLRIVPMTTMVIKAVSDLDQVGLCRQLSGCECCLAATLQALPLGSWLESLAFLFDLCSCFLVTVIFWSIVAMVDNAI